MGLTLFGAIILVVGMILLVRGNMSDMLVFLVVTTLFGGAAAISFGGRGASSIPPAQLALLFVLLRATLPGERQMAQLGEAVRANIFLIVFVAYGVVSAILLPRLFAGQIEVTPLHPNAFIKFELVRLQPSAQNVTTAIYLIGTLISGLCSYIAVRRPGAAGLIVRIGIGIAITHALLGFYSILVAGTPLQASVDFFRNGNYAQLNQGFDNFRRMSGIWPEPAAFANYGAAWFIFMSELWLRDVRPRATGFAATLLGTALVVSTSSTAYVVLGVYAAVFALRCILLPWSLPTRKLFALLLSALAVVCLAAVAMALVPHIADEFGNIVTQMTVGKVDTTSGQQRLFMARQGLAAFQATYGLGIGAGSFRSSGSIAAIAGCLGVVGLLSFVAHLVSAWKPLRASTYLGVSGDVPSVAAAASWTAVMMLTASAVASPTCDPGLLWAMFCGFAIGLRPSDRQAPTFSNVTPGMPIVRAPALSRALHGSPE